MSKLSIDQITAGMILAEPVNSKAGRLLMTAGLELTEKHLTILRTWGVQEVAIASGHEGTPVGLAIKSSEISAEQVETVMNELRPIFSQVDLSHPVFIELFRLAARKKVLKNG